MPTRVTGDVRMLSISVEGPSQQEEVGTRITETGDERVTETGDVRVIEG